MSTQVDETKITLRMANRSDIDLLVRFEKVCFPGEAAPKKLLVQQFKCGAKVIIALRSNEPVGFMRFTVGKKGRPPNPGRIWITKIATLPTARKQGIATTMIKWLMDFASTTKIKTKTIALSVRASNMDAQGVYKNLGFATVGEKANFYSDGESAYLMEYAYK